MLHNRTELQIPTTIEYCTEKPLIQIKNMELKIDLLKIDKKSRFNIVLGILSFIFLSDKIYRLILGTVLKPIDWFFFGCYTLCGIALVAEGFGFSIERLFGKAYILINPELISLKSGVFTKEQSVYWNNIKFIDFNLNKLRIEKTDNTNLIINLSTLGYSLKNEFIGTIDCIAKEKSIKSNI